MKQFFVLNSYRNAINVIWIFISWNKDEDAEAQDVCRQLVGICTRIRIPVCASNGNTYDNQCMLNEAICVQNQTKIEKNVETGKSDVALFKMFDGVCPTNSISSTRGKQTTEWKFL